MKKQRIKNVISCILNQSHLKMKFTLLFLFLSLAQVSAYNSYGQNNKVTLSENQVTLSQVLQQIENQTDFLFFYNSKELDSNQKVSLNVDNLQIVDVLSQFLNDLNISYHILGNQIVLKKSDPETAINVLIKKQQLEVTVTIIDATGMPMVGVTVILEGTNKGTISDFYGKYKVAIDAPGQVLVFSSLGYKTERVIIGEDLTIDLEMDEDLSQLDEVVIIGYGQQKKENVTGAVSTIDTKQVVQAATGSVGFDRALGGLVKGVQVSQSSGRPGSPVNLNIRGITSPLSSGSNQPLIVIDGFPFNSDNTNLGAANPLLTLNPNDIKSFNVLKDVAATSIYGSRGANGVIIIETNKGKRNQDAKVNLSYSTTLAQPINTVDVLNAKEYRQFYDTLISNTVSAMNAGQMDPFFAFDLANIGNVDIDFNTFQVSYDGLRDDYFGAADTDWSNEVFRSLAITKQANIGVSGGSDKSNYSLSLAFIDQEGLTRQDGIKQYTFASSLDTDVNTYIKIGGALNFSHSNTKSGEEDVFGQYTVNSSIARARPDLPVYDDNGELLGQADFANGFQTYEPNPLMRLQNKTNNKGYNFIGNTYLEVEPIKDLKIKADINAAIFYADNSSFIPKVAQTDFVIFPNQSLLSETQTLSSNLTTNLTADYAFNFSDHHFTVLAGAAWERRNSDYSSMFYVGFPDDDFLINGSSAESIGAYTDYRVETGLNSLLSRVTYRYSNLYNATINWRRDASSKFGPQNKSANFPSLSLGWNMMNENFLMDVEAINTLKLRLSAGRVGSTNLPDYAYELFLESNSDDIYNGNSAVVPSDDFPNKGVAWEETSEYNVGLDYEFFNSRLRGGIDVYNRKTEGALVNTPIPYELGGLRYTSNFIDIENKGVEVSLGGDIVRNDNFTWSANVNWSLNRNKLVKLQGSNINQFLLDYFIEGEPVGTIKGYKVVKIFQSQDEVDALNAASPEGLYDQMSTSAGDYMYEDLNGDGEISIEDRTVIGTIQPDFFGGISNTFTYKNFSMTALMQYSVGGERTWDNIPFGSLNLLGENKYSEYGLNTWTPDNPEARYARALYFDPSQSSRTSDKYLYDTSYLRLKSVQLRYAFDKTVLNKLGFDHASIVLSATNLFTWTKWPGMDPETFSERSDIASQTNSEDPYPLSKSFSLGVQLQF
ncbi:TonB-dependent receptor [Bizionia gelidisalsuginis]|uniref:TonB-dependent receptor n=2 Tax=Bizionia gelidisalsuginis TaxID=291188 RepID=A0ABY3M9V7_9FLAO|nr:TonB-dependent receptor [Bizionia gelidisalsuginis]